MLIVGIDRKPRGEGILQGPVRSIIPPRKEAAKKANGANGDTALSPHFLAQRFPATRT
jgi:hypothetical protein